MVCTHSLTAERCSHTKSVISGKVGKKSWKRELKVTLLSHIERPGSWNYIQNNTSTDTNSRILHGHKHNRNSDTRQHYPTTVT